MRDPYSHRVILFARQSTSFLSWPKFFTAVFMALLTYGLQWWFGLHTWKEAMEIIATVIASYMLVCILAVLRNLVLAPSRMDAEANEETEALRNKCADLQAKLDERMPRLEAEIFQFVFAELEIASGKFPCVLITMEIRNIGEPSIADRFTVTVKTVEGNEIRGDLQTVDNLTMNLSEGERTYEKTSEIIEKAVRSPIQKGSKITGRLMARFTGVSLAQIGAKGNSIVVSFEDVYRKECSLTKIVEDLNPNLLKLRYPGEDH